VDKSDSDMPGGVFGLQASGSRRAQPALFVNLLDTSHVLMDGTGAAFNLRYSAAIDSADVQKRWNEEIENIALIRGDKALAIELRPVPIFSDTLFLRMYLRQHPYLLQVFSQQLPPNLHGTAWIVDKYLQTETEIDLSDTTVYNFTPNTDTNSYRNRFMLVFTPSKPGRAGIIDTFISRIKAHIYPNPVSGKTFNLVLKNGKKDEYIVNIYALSGKLAVTRKISYVAGKYSYTITVPPYLAAGSYTVNILNGDGVCISSIPVIISK
jgi:hypothetical protein